MRTPTWLILVVGLMTPVDSAVATFADRCNAPGVIKCLGFDQVSDVLNGNEYTGPTYVTKLKYADGNIAVFDPDESHSPLNGYRDSRVTVDTQIQSSGAGSLRFTIPSKTSSNHSGTFRVSFCDFQRPGYSGPCQFGEHASFYIQYRQRFGPKFLSFYLNGTPPPANNSSSWKTSVIHWNKAGCGQTEIAMNNAYWRGLPHVYTACGDRRLALYRDPYGQGDYWIQWAPPYQEGGPTHNIYQKKGAPWFPNPTGVNEPSSTIKCHFSQRGGYQEPECLRFVENEWMTFYWVVHMGTWGGQDSSVELWVSRRPSDPLTQIVDQRNFIFKQTNTGAVWDMIQLEVYMTRKDATVDHVPVQTWYDDLIISTQPIADPVGQIPPQTPPIQELTGSMPTPHFHFRREQ